MSTRITFARLNKFTLHQLHLNSRSRPLSGGMTRTELLPGLDRRQLGVFVSTSALLEFAQYVSRRRLLLVPLDRPPRRKVDDLVRLLPSAKVSLDVKKGLDGFSILSPAILACLPSRTVPFLEE